jgi:hypothetical protein
VCYAEAVVVNHGVLCLASGCESWYVMLSQWLWIMVSYDEPVVVNHGVLWWASVMSHCELRWTKLVAVNHGVFCCASVCESWWVILSQWLWIMCTILSQWMWIMTSNAEPVFMNHRELCWASGCESLCVILFHWMWIIVRYAELVFMNHGELCWASGCE